MVETDILIIGSGTAGQSAAYDLISEGFTVTVVDKSSRPGGVCALHGCQAKKWFYEVAEMVAKSHHLAGLGVTAAPTIDWNKIREAKNRFTSQIPKETVANLTGNGIEYIEGEVVFTSPDSVSINGFEYKPQTIIIAAGAKPMPLPIEGSNFLMTSNDFLDLEKLPRRILFVGGGFISFEFAHFAARLGSNPSDIHILEVADRPLGPFDAEMVAQLCRATHAEGIQIHTGVKIERIVSETDAFSVRLASGESIETDLVVHGAGRIPDIDGLNLEAANITTNRRGIIVDSQMRTSAPAVFAVGDCVDTIQLARVADQEAHVAAATIARRESGISNLPSIDYSAVPAVLFTYPQLGMVGATEEELIDADINYWKSTGKDLSWPTYRRIGMKHAAYKIMVDSEGKILGAHFISDNTTGLVNIFKQAMLDGKRASDIHHEHIISPYPSRESDIIYMLDGLLD